MPDDEPLRFEVGANVAEVVETIVRVIVVDLEETVRKHIKAGYPVRQDDGVGAHYTFLSQIPNRGTSLDLRCRLGKRAEAAF
jgi:hypothetical protein